MMRLNRPIDPSRDHFDGSPHAPILLVEYGDFECPHCRRAYAELRTVRRRLGESLCIVFREFPLSRIHPHAAQAAEAAEAAGAQGQFWPMHRLLFEHQEALEIGDLLGYARSLDLDLRLFADALATNEYMPRIREDFLGGVRSGVNGTPCFFLDNERYDGAWDAQTLIALLEGRQPGAHPHAHA